MGRLRPAWPVRLPRHGPKACCSLAGLFLSAFLPLAEWCSPWLDPRAAARSWQTNEGHVARGHRDPDGLVCSSGIDMPPRHITWTVRRSQEYMFSRCGRTSDDGEPVFTSVDPTQLSYDLVYYANGSV